MGGATAEQGESKEGEKSQNDKKVQSFNTNSKENSTLNSQSSQSSSTSLIFCARNTVLSSAENTYNNKTEKKECESLKKQQLDYFFFLSFLCYYSVV